MSDSVPHMSKLTENTDQIHLTKLKESLFFYNGIKFFEDGPSVFVRYMVQNIFRCCPIPSSNLLRVFALFYINSLIYFCISYLIFSKHFHHRYAASLSRASTFRLYLSVTRYDYVPNNSPHLMHDSKILNLRFLVISILHSIR